MNDPKMSCGHRRLLGTIPGTIQYTIAMMIVTMMATMATACGGVEYPACETDDDCKQNEFCVNQLCQQCRGDADCGTGQQCVGGACQGIPGFCNSDSDCGPGEACENNSCVAMQSGPAAPPPPAPVKESCSLEPVYFAFDSSDLEGGSRAELQSNADCIREKNIGAVHLTGMTDPRGTEEYNMALGDRRARSAKKYLETLGVDAKITYSSMGEEMASGTDESGWARDRRVEIKQR